MSKLFIGVKRIIAVDSSEFAYAELDVDQHCMLVAEGNVGKSSLINAIRLFFLPECSMAKQAVNFGFSDSHGDMYASETSFNHYFPSKYSFLILEYEKRLFDGPHCCQIISASNNGRLKFERMFTQLPYAELRHLFWQAGDDPDGIGERVDGLSKQKLYDYIQKHDTRCILAKEPSKVASLLYESDLQNTRFTLFPLKDQEPQTINSLRALIKLLFVASGKNKKPFTDAIANIIEGGKKSSHDQLGFSISEFKQRHESLKQQELHLTTVINQQTKYQQLIKTKATFESYLAMLEPVKPAIQWLKDGKSRLQEELQQFADMQALAKSKLAKAIEKTTQLNDDMRHEKRVIKEKNRELADAQKVVDRVAQLNTEFHSQELDYIVDALNDDLVEKQTEFDVLNGNVSRDEALAKIHNQIAELENTRDTLRRALDNTEFNLSSQLSKTQLDWLYSVNPELANANPGAKLSKSDQDAIAHFAALFSEQPQHYRFYDTQISFKAFNQINRQQQLDKIEQEVEACHKQAQKLQNQQQNALHSEQSLKQVRQSIELLNADLTVLKEYEYATKRAKDLSTDIDIASTQLAALEKTVGAAESQRNIIKIECVASENDYRECRQRIEEQIAFLKRLTEFSGRHAKWLNMLPDEAEFTGYLNEQKIGQFEDSATQLEQLQSQLISGLRTFVELNIVDDKQGIKGDVPFWNEVCACFDDVSEVFGNLDTQRGLLGKQIEEHNQTIGTKKQVIIQNYKVIKAFEKEINHAFTGITINNVAAVEFSVGINKQFETLVKEFEETNLYSNQMQSDDFYIRLVAFAERFFDSDENFTLTMDKIIESFEPRVQLNNKSGKEDKKQSNSTNSLIKIKLVQLLLKRLIYHNCETSFPIVHDEIANIDIGQFNWWLADLSAAGFNLMAAGTHSTSPELQAKIGRRHVMDALTTALPYHAERSRVYWQGAEEFSERDQSDVDVEQTELI